MAVSGTDATGRTGSTPNGMADDAFHILVVDDDRRIRSLLQKYLAGEGYRVSVAGDAAEARRQLEGLSFDLLIVDVMMPGETGTAFTAGIRERLDVPVLMLTALGETDARIKGLQAGADDYLAKPFDPRELVLRMEAILRRTASETVLDMEQVLFGPYTFAMGTRELKCRGEAVRLTDREQDIMALFAANAGQVVPRMDLIGEDTGGNERTVDVQINRLRRKIEPDPADPTWLQTVRGVGYKLHIE